MSEKPWGGRFRAATDRLVEQFNASIDIDRRMAMEDLQGSKAHARMLALCGILSREECAAILQGLEEIGEEIRSGSFPFSQALEDIHMNIEQRLTERIGDAGKKLHTARSRNDQVATDMRLYLRRRATEIEAWITRLQQALVARAEEHADTVMPGFTHLQSAQPVTFGHHLLAWVEMLERDRGRFADARRRMNHSPLGSAALAGTTFPIDRAMTARALGFDGPCRNSLDAVSDRDFVIELLAAAALCAVHLSRICEELILWMSAQFHFIELPDEYCTGSSIMPQKKNPDMPELIRGKSGRIIGGLMAMLTTMKGLPLAYNKDMQEDKAPIFDALDQLEGALTILAAMVPGMRPDRRRMREAAAAGFATATDLADRLVRAGVPFRTAHRIVGEAVAWCEAHGCELHEMDEAACQVIDPSLHAEMVSDLSVEGCVAARNHFGGTAPEQVRHQCAWWRTRWEEEEATTT
ncbi:MAG: argininosuccinate lyase [Zetaproteobacteria bacterium]|nr:MAG: argininosuccinate lyase [Zetaproteobacteria bacterium]